MVGGLVGGYYVTITDCSVIGNDGSSVTATFSKADVEGDSVGGLVGMTGEYSTTQTSITRVKDVTVENLDVSGTRKVGGIIGYMNYGVAAEDITASELTVSTNADSDYISANEDKISVGGIVGECSGSGNYPNNPSVLKDATISNSKVTGIASATTGDVLGKLRGTVSMVSENIQVNNVVVSVQ